MITLLLALTIAAPCEVDGVQAECGSFSVPENRALKEGRKLELHYAVVRADPKIKSADAIFVLPGGPGQAARALINLAKQVFEGSGRDLVFVDPRGTGKSSPLHCDFGGSDDDLAGYFNDMLPTDRVALCREKFRGRTDITQYTTRAIAADFEAARAHLGYASINLYGTSYGTRTAQELMRNHPQHIRAAILQGVVPPTLATPTTFAADAQRSLDGVLAMCRKDAACSKTYPNLAADYQAMLKSVEGGLSIDVEDPKTKKVVRVKINRGFFGEIFRNFLYTPDRFVGVPKAIHAASKGDWSAFSALAVPYATGIRTLDFGLFFSITCTEDIPRMDVIAAKESTRGTLFGSYRIEQQLAACKEWSRGVADPAASTILKSKIPTLLLSGELDPVTPPRFANEVAAGLSRSVALEVIGGSHFGDTGGCLEKISVQFIRDPSIEKLDTACIANIKRPAFEL